MPRIREIYDEIDKNHLITESHEDYNDQRKDFTTSSDVKLIVKESMADFKHAEDHPSNEVKPAYILGNAVHCMLNEGMKQYSEMFVVGGPRSKAGVEYGILTDAFRDDRKDVNFEGKELITNEFHSYAMKMRKSCLKHPIIKAIYAEGVGEKVLRTEYMGMPVQVRFDWLSPNVGIPDLKTCRNLKDFLREARYKFGYFYQAGFYQTMPYLVFPDLGYLPFLFIAVESKAPYKCGPFKMGAEDMEYYRQGVMDAMLYLKNCRESGIYPTGYEDMIHIQ